MAACNIGACMTGLGNRLRTITGLRVFDYPPDKVDPPVAIVAFPETVTYDDTFARGSDRLVFPVHVLVGRVSERTAAVRIGEYMSGTGAKSVKSAIEADRKLAGAAQTTRVQEADVSIMTVAAVDYLSATFLVEVIT